MPVRVYDIAKKLGLENKEILSKAKEMGIAAAKVPSSSLDKISAEWLEEEIIRTNPAVAARLAPKPPEEKPKPAPVRNPSWSSTHRLNQSRRLLRPPAGRAAGDCARTRAAGSRSEARAGSPKQD